MPARRTNHSGQARQRVCDRPQARREQPFTSYQPENADHEDGEGDEVFGGRGSQCSLRETHTDSVGVTIE